LELHGQSENVRGGLSIGHGAGRGFGASFGAGIVLVALAGACGLETSGLDPEEEPGGQRDAAAESGGGSGGRDTGTTEAGEGTDAATDGAREAGDDADAGAPDGSADARADGLACVPTGAENCTDGIDNDCNGVADCADPACQPQFQCVPGVPPTWTRAVLNESGRTACPTGYTGARDVIVDPNLSPATCACTCGAATVTCNAGSFTVSGGPNDAECATAREAPFPTNNGTCRALSVTVPASTSLRIAAAPPSSATCGVNQSTTLPAQKNGRTCDGSNMGSAGCAPGNVCVRRAPAPYTQCIRRPGRQTCPGTFPNAKLTATSLTDTRACSTCVCGAQNAVCANATVSIFGNETCSAAPAGASTATLDGTCREVTSALGSVEVRSYRYNATGTATCAKTQDATPIGSAVPVGEETVCCL
jgi:hypothetical protein